MTEQFLRRKDAAKYIRSRYGFCGLGTLEKLATMGGGPKFRKIGKAVIYDPADLDAWARSKMSAPVSSTSEYQREAA